MVNPANAKDSNICHIEAANEDGERYNPNMSDRERADYGNLILLCVQHHDETNDVDRFPVEKLLEMKRQHESNQMTRRLNQNPSMLANTISAIAGIDTNSKFEQESLNSFSVRDKIKHNSIKRNVSMIDEYKVYHQRLNTLYDELESQGSIKKESLLNNVRGTYTQVIGNIVMDSPNRLEIIQENSDKIIDEVFEILYSKLAESEFWEEDIIFGLRLILVDAFMRCKILEEPS
ncbi:hypothetical protein GCM10027297_10560 [Parahaliea aestuarii]